MHLRETHMIGSRTIERMVSPNVCAALAGYGVTLCGTSRARRDFRFVRTRPAMTQVLACLSGSGEVLVNGRFVRCGPGRAYVTPRDTLHAYRGPACGAWHVAWVMFNNVSARGPALIPADSESLWNAIEGLHRESVGACEGAVMHTWATLVANLAMRTIGEMQIDARVQMLWQDIDQRLAEPWDCQRLAANAGMSREHLRRLCVRQLRVSPLRHLRAMRLRKADSLLRTGAYRVEAVAHLVGYDNPFAFSTAFRRQFGTAPSEVIPSVK